jgi:hypothetical protein
MVEAVAEGAEEGFGGGVEKVGEKLQLAPHSRTVNRELRTVLQWRPPSGFRKTFWTIGLLALISPGDS